MARGTDSSHTVTSVGRGQCCDAGVMSQWPKWATEQVHVRDPLDAWIHQGDRLCRQLDDKLAQWLRAPVEHVGSTAVPGLPAKPIIDVQAAVLDLECAIDVAEALAADGWHLVPPELDARPWRRFLVRVADESRAAHLHLLPIGSARWYDQLAFRDALRADTALTREYANLKRTLAAQHADDREAYTASKAEFVRSVLQGASRTAR